MQERKKMQFYSVVSLLGVFELCTAQDVVIGLDSARKTVNEQSENFTICANVLSSISSSYSINVSVIYQDRSAVGGQDFIETPHSFLFTPSQTEHCFDVCLINDDIYEVRQEFFVNLTSNSPGVTLSPQFSIIVVDDDDRVVIGWERDSYTVGEADGQLQIHVRFTGTLESTLPQAAIIVEGGTAIRGQDFMFPDHIFVNFPQGSDSSSKMTFTVELLKDIEYEGEKSFSLMINPTNAERFTIEPQRTTIVITDCNVITEQQPLSGCDGINNLINSSSTVEICRPEVSNSVYCDVLTCSTIGWSLSLLFQACDRTAMLNVTDRTSGVIFSETFTSGSQPQELNHTLGNQTGSINLISRVVEESHYLVSLDAPLLNISFPMTAVPVECLTTGITSLTSTTNRTGLILAVVAVVAVLLVVTIGIFFGPQCLKNRRTRTSLLYGPPWRSNNATRPRLNLKRLCHGGAPMEIINFENNETPTFHLKSIKRVAPMETTSMENNSPMKPELRQHIIRSGDQRTTTNRSGHPTLPTQSKPIKTKQTMSGATTQPMKSTTSTRQSASVTKPKKLRTTNIKASKPKEPHSQLTDTKTATSKKQSSKPSGSTITPKQNEVLKSTVSRTQSKPLTKTEQKLTASKSSKLETRSLPIKTTTSIKPSTQNLKEVEDKQTSIQFQVGGVTKKSTVKFHHKTEVNKRK